MQTRGNKLQHKLKLLLFASQRNPMKKCGVAHINIRDLFTKHRKHQARRTRPKIQDKNSRRLTIWKISKGLNIPSITFLDEEKHI